MLITDSYRQEQTNLHKTGKYGTASLQYGQVVSNLLDRLNSRSILDYGCGSMYNVKEPADLVVCIDVLEHIEPELLDNVLDDLRDLTRAWAYLTIHTGPAVKRLSDGRNAHLIQESPAWWLPKLLERWNMQTFNATNSGFNVLMRAK